MITLLIYFIVAVILFAVAYYAVNSLLPEGPIKKFAIIILVVVAAIVVCWMLLGMAGGGGMSLPHINR